MSVRIENKLVADGQALVNRIITLRSQSCIPTFAFRKKILSIEDSDKARALDTWSGLGSVIDSEEHAIDYEPLGHAMIIVADALGGSFHDTSMFVLPEEMSSICLIEPYDILLQDEDRLRNKPDWMPQKGDLFCFMLNEHKEYHEVTGIMAKSMLASQGARYALAQRFDLNYLDAFNEQDIADVAVPYD